MATTAWHFASAAFKFNTLINWNKCTWEKRSGCLVDKPPIVFYSLSATCSDILPEYYQIPYLQTQSTNSKVGWYQDWYLSRTIDLGMNSHHNNDQCYFLIPLSIDFNDQWSVCSFQRTKAYSIWDFHIPMKFETLFIILIKLLLKLLFLQAKIVGQ